MFDENKYRACFDMVKAPESMEREILNMTTEKNKIRKVGFGRRIAVVAAVLVMVLSLGIVAQAAGWFNLGDAVIGRLDMPENDVPTVMGEGETAPNVEEFIGLIGAKGSPEYEGVKEWFEYYWSEEYEIVSTEEAITDPAYNIYGAFSQKSIDVLDAICEKYGLLLVDGQYTSFGNNIDALYDATSCHGLLKPEAGHGVHGGYWYNSGSFKIEGSVTLSEGWDDPIEYSLMNYENGYLANGGYLKIGAQEDYKQWEYVTSDGVPVTIIHAENRDVLVVNLANSTLAVNVIDFEEGPSGRTEADMEAFAECFDFTAVK